MRIFRRLIGGLAAGVLVGLPWVVTAQPHGAPTPPSSGRLQIGWSVDDGPWTVSPGLSPLVGQRVRLRVAPVDGARIRWFQIIPDVTTMYKNANFPDEPNPYAWIGYAHIKYDKEELTRFRGQWEIEPFKPGVRARLGDWTDAYNSPSARSSYYHPDAGSFWFQAEVEMDGRVRKSPGIEDSDFYGLAPSVFRVSLRDGPGYLGYVTSFLNVPAVFGSVPRQSNHYIGTDCADALAAASGQWLGQEISTNYNVDGLVRKYRHVAEVDTPLESAKQVLPWGKDVRPGDQVAVRYPGSKRYQHVGVLAHDDGNGVLDGADTILHTGPWPLAYDTLGAEGFRGHLAILRPDSPIMERPISFGAARQRATEDYITRHYGRTGQGVKIDPRIIVLHWTETPSVVAAWDTLNKETLSKERGDISVGGEVNVSAHFLVARDGKIFQLMPPDVMARHVIGLNLSAIGIENAGGKNGRDDLTSEQVAANAWLIRQLKDEIPRIQYLIGHHEYRRFEGHPLWLEKEPEYRTRKVDPGDRFMRMVRARVRDLGLHGPPEPK